MIVDLGCGRFKRPGCFGIDCQDLPGVDLICDANDTIPLPDDSVEAIFAFDFLEHVNNNRRIHIMNEIWRILQPNAVFMSHTPSTDGRGAFQDPTHYAFWNENSFLYYTDDRYRALYNITAKFEVISLTTTPKTADGICWVDANLRAIKEVIS
jgi:predicted SAM-dependent methyltransferase